MTADWVVALWQAKVHHYRPLIERIVAQSEWRVLHGEPVPAAAKLVSLFEPHADIIRKGREVLWPQAQPHHRQERPDPRPRYRSGQSGRQRAAAADAGAPRHALWSAGASGRRRRQLRQPGKSAPSQSSRRARHGLPQKGGLGIGDMVRSRRVYRKLRNFRAGIEADISCLKRAYGLARCTWRGRGRFRAYVWSSVVAHNLALLARLQPT